MTSMMRTDSFGGDPATPTMSQKGLNGMPMSQSRPGRSGPQRIDLEPIYTVLKSGIGNNWTLYRESLGLYMLGRLNQEELSMRIDPFIYANANLVHLHNQLIAGIYANIMRDNPETEIASFVSAHDKPTSTAGKQAVGDAHEQRLKAEIMALPARERHRLKQLAEAGGGTEAFQAIMRESRDTWTIRPPDVVPASAGGFGNKTNWELEIGKRYEQPLFYESNEFPDAEMIGKRMVPIAYQEGLAGGCGNGCADLMNVAAESFVKQLLTEAFRRTRSNGVNYVQTSSFRRKLAREEARERRGELKRDNFGLLPVEQEVERHRAPFGVEDLRFSLNMGNNFMAQNKILAAKIHNRALQREPNRDLEVKAARGRMVNGTGMANGIPNGLSNGTNGHTPPKFERNPFDDILDEVMDMGA